jgi:preprotein translocase subunit YajC
VLKISLGSRFRGNDVVFVAPGISPAIVAFSPFFQEDSMFDISQLFIGHAWAQAVPMPPGSESGSPMSTVMGFMPLILIFLVFYVLIIRPQQKKVEEQQKMVKALQRGDRVITTGGIHGKISRIEENAEHLMLEIADGVNVKVLRAHIIGLEAKPNPVATGGEKKS